MSAAAVGTVARWTLLELVRSRLAVTGLVLSAAFVALFVVGLMVLDGSVGDQGRSGLQEETLSFGALASVTVLGLYAVQFLASFLAVLLATGAVAPELRSGALHALLARPVRRAEFLAGRLLTLACLLSGYVVAMAGAMLLTAWVVGGYVPLDPVRTVALMVMQVMVLVAAGLLVSTLLPTVAAGVVLLSLYGLSWLAGIFEIIGGAVGNARMVDLGTAVTLLFPTDALWRGASYYAQPPFLTSDFLDEAPFFAQGPPTAALIAWAAAHALLALAAATVVFRRRDL